MIKTKMKTQDAKCRINNFDEVNLGYDEKDAKTEASRCLNCLNPRCVKGCPVNILIPKFIEQVKLGNIKEAYNIISEDSLFPGICGRVCPQEKQCESMCVKGLSGDAISIGSLERYVADEARKNKFNKIIKKEDNGLRVAIVGSGPSSLACAALLLKEGFQVTIFESLHKAGGVLTYGIPEFRLPKQIVIEEIESLKELGAKIITNTIIGVTRTIEELKEEFDAIYIATGAGLPKFMGILNEDANGVFSANELLTRINLMKSYKDDAKTPLYSFKKALVIGGGNVAMDAARSLRRLGGEVTICYRRSMDELPARKEEVNHAIEEGIEFKLLVSPKEIVVDDKGDILGLKVSNMELVDLGEMRKSVKEIENSFDFIDADMIVMAIGTDVNPILTNNSDIKVDSKGLIITDGTKTSDDKIFAGGDAVTGAATVIMAMEAGKRAAKDIIEYLNS